jgi:ABC-type antimicrobial peptide transport system permease subunit
MTFRDLIDVSLRNLWRTKLRAVLTITGVIIAIATFVAMLSFAAGNHRYFKTAFNEFGLMNQMSVRPQNSNTADTTEAAILDNDAIRAIAAIPGVILAYPYSSFDVTASVLDTTVTTSVRSLPLDAVKTRLFSKILGGYEFSSEFASEALVTHEFVEMVKSEPESLLGKTVVISMKVASLDSAIAATIGDPGSEMQRLFRIVDLDSIRNEQYQRRLVQRELSARFQGFITGLMERQVTVADTLTIIGVAPADTEYRYRTSPIVVPQGVSRRLSSSGIAIAGNPASIFEAARNGALFDPVNAYDSRSYPRVTLELKPLANHSAIKDSIETLGYQAFSFAEQFDEMQRFMVYYYLGLGIIGLIAMATASLGIINTMVMSITERRKEIGILKSLGAWEGDIRKLFLVESSVIGAIGAGIGIVVGWIGTRVAAIIMKSFMEREDMPVFDPFTFPLWLIALALGFGIIVSLMAGLYPAARAARVDPVEALRTD